MDGLTRFCVQEIKYIPDKFWLRKSRKVLGKRKNAGNQDFSFLREGLKDYTKGLLNSELFITGFRLNIYISSNFVIFVGDFI